MQAGYERTAETWLRSGVALAGDTPGWFRAALEALLMRLDGGTVNRLRKELARARQAPPTREAVMAVIAMLGQPDTAENRKAVVGLLFGMRDWLLQAAPFDWPAGRCMPWPKRSSASMRSTSCRSMRARRVGGTPATQAGGSTTSSPVPVAKWDGCRWERPTSLAALADHAISRNDFHAANRIERFLAGVHGQAKPAAGRRPPWRTSSTTLRWRS